MPAPFDVFVIDSTGNVVNCIVVDNPGVARRVINTVHGADHSFVERRTETRAIETGDAFDKVKREFTSVRLARKFPVTEPGTVVDIKD